MTEKKQIEDAKKKTQENENIIASIGTIVLTDEYVYQISKRFGNESYKCIFLKDVSSFELGYKSYPNLLIAAVLLLCYSFVDNAVLCVGIAIGFVIAFCFMRTNSIIISAHNKETISEPLIGRKDEAKIFLNKLVEMKKKFIK